MRLYGAPRARKIKVKRDLFTPALREREYTIIWNYQIILTLFSIFFSKRTYQGTRGMITFTRGVKCNSRNNILYRSHLNYWLILT